MAQPTQQIKDDLLLNLTKELKDIVSAIETWNGSNLEDLKTHHSRLRNSSYMLSSLLDVLEYIDKNSSQ